MTWIKARRCDSGQCAWVWRGYRTVWLRDDAGETLVIDHGDWRTLIVDLREGRLR